jgi:hypothetical protein
MLQRKNIEFYKNIRSLRERKFLLESQSTSSLFIETSVVDENTQEGDGILEIDNDDSVEEMVDDRVITNEEEKSMEPSVLQIYKHEDLFKKILPEFDILKEIQRYEQNLKLEKYVEDGDVLLHSSLSTTKSQFSRDILELTKP